MTQTLDVHQGAPATRARLYSLHSPSRKVSALRVTIPSVIRAVRSSPFLREPMSGFGVEAATPRSSAKVSL